MRVCYLDPKKAQTVVKKLEATGVPPMVIEWVHA